MRRTVRHIALPSGGWWELETRPRWKHVREFVRPRCGTSGQLSQPDLIDRALVSLTTAWSFHEPVSVDSLEHRDTEDVVAVLKVLEREVMPLWNGSSPRLLAEDLLSGLVTGRVPDEFSEAHIMAVTGWSWAALMETPVDVVEKMAIYLAVRHVRDIGGALDFAEEHHER